jgi:threonine aldolase
VSDQPDFADGLRKAMEASGTRRFSGAGRGTVRSGLQGLAAWVEGLDAETAAAYDLDGTPDTYGDGLVATLERRVAGLLGTQDAAYFPTGTMAQQVAFRCWARETGDTTVAIHPLAHPEVHERHAYRDLTGLRGVWPTTEPRNVTARELRACAESFGTLALELPMRDAGFVLPAWDELEAVVAVARERGARVHFDGARLWETTVHFGRPLDEIAGLADSVYVSFYKSLGGASGAAVGGPAAFVAEMKTWRHRYGGQIFQQWPAVLGALRGLDLELPRLPAYVAHAAPVAEALAAAGARFPGVRVHPSTPHTHQFRLYAPFDAAAMRRAGVDQIAATGNGLFGFWAPANVPGVSFTEVTVARAALGWKGDEVAEAWADLLARAAAAAGTAV